MTGWALLHVGGRDVWRRVLGAFCAEIDAEGTTTGRSYRVVEAPTGAVLWTGTTIVTLDRAQRGLEHLLATQTQRRTGEVPRLD